VVPMALGAHVPRCRYEVDDAQLRHFQGVVAAARRCVWLYGSALWKQVKQATVSGGWGAGGTQGAGGRGAAAARAFVERGACGVAAGRGWFVPPSRHPLPVCMSLSRERWPGRGGAGGLAGWRAGCPRMLMQPVPPLRSGQPSPAHTCGGAAAVASFLAAVLTEIHLCGVYSCQESRNQTS
jgi:hypothetical protein